jgi:hypothetical protein
LISSNDIQYLKNKQIDRKAWDSCITESISSRIYALSWYLDACCDHWDGLVYGDYEAVMPLPIRYKFGVIPYIYLSYLTQQLGVFCRKDILHSTSHWLNKIPRRFLGIDYLLHSETRIDAYYQKYPNLILNLDKPYVELQNNYKKNRIRDLKKAKEAGLQIESMSNISDFITELNSASKYYDYEQNWRDMITRLYMEGNKKNILYMARVKDLAEQSLYMLLYGLFKGRIYYLIPFSMHQMSKATGAATFLIDALIKKHCEEIHHFDFEGSRIESLAKFYKSFGAKEEYYYHYRKRGI